MISLINVTKTYNRKKRNAVRALNNVSVRFPDKGMVFLMGKSGSGKSTLLNIIGGLDSYDSGDIIVNNVSSKKFKQSHFDSYRNTYVGFVFQEYNLLSDFSVKDNIGLALQLQGKKPDEGKINQILDQLDIGGYANRKISELSGGEKQRVTIARALIKNPEIILADEPTGALDSKTGKQILDILKQLSKDKLVVVVSHDEKFAREYGDRIIELKDGEVISDTTLDTTATNKKSEIDELREKYHISLEDAEKLKSQLKVSDNGKNFKETSADDIEVDDNRKFKLIKSALPFSSSLKIAISSLGHKKFKLVITILLSMIAFTMFGFIDSAINYNHSRVSYQSFVDSDINFISLGKIWRGNGGSLGGISFNDDDINYLKNEYSIEFVPVVESYGFNLFTSEGAYINGAVSLNKNDLNRFGFSMLAGRLPENSNEIALSDYYYYLIEKYGINYYDNETGTGKTVFDPKEIIGACIDQGSNICISGFVNTGFYERDYDVVKNESSRSFELNEFSTNSIYNFYEKVFVCEETFNKMTNNYALKDYYEILYQGSVYDTVNKVKIADEVKDEITWFDESHQYIGQNEVVLDASIYQYLPMSEYGDKTITIHETNHFEVTGDDIVLKVVGVTNDASSSCLVFNRDFLNDKIYGKYFMLIAPVPADQDTLKYFFNHIYDTLDNGIGMSVCNAANNQAEAFKTSIEYIRKYLLYVGFVLAGFAMILFGNYLSTSISYKKKEIGILRAIGSRGKDVFKIFFLESLLIALINFVLSSLSTFGVITFMNVTTRNNSGILVTFLSFGIKQVVLLLLLCVVTAFVSSYIPIKVFSNKKPVESIRENN